MMLESDIVLRDNQQSQIMSICGGVLVLAFRWVCCAGGKYPPGGGSNCTLLYSPLFCLSLFIIGIKVLLPPTFTSRALSSTEPFSHGVDGVDGFNVLHCSPPPEPFISQPEESRKKCEFQVPTGDGVQAWITHHLLRAKSNYPDIS